MSPHRYDTHAQSSRISNDGGIYTAWVDNDDSGVLICFACILRKSMLVS